VRALRIIIAVVSVLSWLVFSVVVSPILFRFGDLHNWHGTDDPAWVAYMSTVVAAFGFALSVAIAFGVPRWMLWSSLVLSLLITFLWAAPSVALMRLLPA
jgi:hypothetical protein